ncbi:hypothetical protein E2562_031378 [Oryza meyeriana var. granulata]|uniref:Uncharacterized protein n=1 Tax=Oryza meyeriana var. granulata TaxID=110450 RepID=A0A6G1DQV6_9ORYZ|nr:hypothetical protein E2562_031378 [Oryza meyeriana var. granulata]
MPTLAGTAAPSFVAVERLTPLTRATEEDPATAGEATPASIVLPTTEDDTTAAVEVSFTAFADIDEAARRPTPLIGATEDYPPTEEDPASTVEGDTTDPAEVSASVFPDVDKAAGRPAPLIGVTKDYAPTAKDPATTAEGTPTSVVVATTERDTTSAAEVSSNIVAETDDPIIVVDLAASTIDDD